MRAIALLVSLHFAALAFAGEQQPIEAFARRPQVDHVSISPDGRFLAFVMREGDVSSVIVNDRSGKLEPRKVWMGLGRNSADVDWCRWANPTRLLCSLSRTIAPEPYVAARYDPIVLAARLLAMDFDGGRRLMLVDKNWQSAQFEARQNQLVSLTHADNDGVLVQMFTVPRYEPQTSRSRQDVTPATVVYRLDIYTGELEERTRLDRFASYYADSDGEVRLAHVPKDDATVTYHYRLPGESKWRPWWTFQHGDFSNLFRPVQPIAGTSRFLAIRQHQGRLGLWDLDMKTMQAQMLSSSSQFDVEVGVHAPGSELLSVERGGDGSPQAEYFDARARDVIAAARYLHPDMSHAILDSAANDNVYLLRSSSDADAGTYRVLDLRNGPAPLEQIGTSYPELAAVNLPRMTSIKYRARRRNDSCVPHDAVRAGFDCRSGGSAA